MCHIDHKDGSLASKSQLNLDTASSAISESALAKLMAIGTSENPAVALTANETRNLFVARSNGDVLRYRLPELWPEICIHTSPKLPVRIEVNCDAT